MESFKYSKKRHTLLKQSGVIDIEDGNICYKSDRGTLRIGIKKINKIVIGKNDDTPNHLIIENPHLLLAIHAGGKKHYFLQSEDTKLGIHQLMERLNEELDKMPDYQKMLSMDPDGIYDEIEMDECAEIDIIPPRDSNDDFSEDDEPTNAKALEYVNLIVKAKRKFLRFKLAKEEKLRKKMSAIGISRKKSSEISKSIINEVIGFDDQLMNEEEDESSASPANADTDNDSSDSSEAGKSKSSTSKKKSLMKKMSRKMSKIEESNQILWKSHSEIKESIQSADSAQSKISPISSIASINETDDKESNESSSASKSVNEASVSGSSHSESEDSSQRSASKTPLSLSEYHSSSETSEHTNEKEKYSENDSGSSSAEVRYDLMQKMSKQLNKIEEENKNLRESLSEMRASMRAMQISQKNSSKISDIIIDEVMSIDDEIDQMQKHQSVNRESFNSQNSSTSSEDKDRESQSASNEESSLNSSNSEQSNESQNEKDESSELIDESEKASSDSSKTTKSSSISSGCSIKMRTIKRLSNKVSKMEEESRILRESQDDDIIFGENMRIEIDEIPDKESSISSSNESKASEKNSESDGNERLQALRQALRMDTMAAKIEDEEEDTDRVLHLMQENEDKQERISLLESNLEELMDLNDKINTSEIAEDWSNYKVQKAKYQETIKTLSEAIRNYDQLLHESTKCINDVRHWLIKPQL